MQGENVGGKVWMVRSCFVRLNRMQLKVRRSRCTVGTRSWPGRGNPCLVVSVCVCLLAARASESCAETFFPSKLQEMHRAIEQAIGKGEIPGGVLWLERTGEKQVKAFGHRALEPDREAMTVDTIFDAASLTKVVATAPSVMLLVERGDVGLEVPVKEYVEEFTGDERERITVRHLLTHTSGLPPGISPNPPWEGYEKAIALACRAKPLSPPGTIFRYSDVNFILLGELVRRVSGEGLDRFARTHIFEPLKMKDTGFLPAKELKGRIAPTEKVKGEVLRGEVHDPTARRMGGVAGHAGLFLTASDLARFARMFLQGGVLEGKRVLQEDTVRRMTTVQSPDTVPSRRGLGWDIDSPYSGPRGQHFPLGSYGHTGWTGTSIWIDPFSETFLLFLSNRNHPTEEGSVLALRRRLGTMAAEGVRGFHFAYVPGALPPRQEPADRRSATSGSEGGQRKGTGEGVVWNGIDVLREEGFERLKGKRLGLITNQTGHDRRRLSTIDLLHNAEGMELKALFSPEHGIRGELEGQVEDDKDEKTGLPVYSLYGQTRKPLNENLEGLDALVFDIQDIGTRFYTYISTMGLCMEAAAEAGLSFYVLDRVNPINGVAMDGPVLNTERSFVGWHPIPIRHGMTVGELARMFQAERAMELDLEVVKIQGWRREVWLDETGLPWTNPSPNMRSLKQAILYPGVGLLETTALSVGRGTDTPFERVGAPYIDDVQLAKELNSAGLPGVRFLPIRFTPRSSVFAGKECRGVYILLTDRNQCLTVDIGILAAKTLLRLYPEEFDLEPFHRLLGHRATIKAIRSGKSVEEIRKIWGMDLEEFQQRRAKYLLY